MADGRRSASALFYLGLLLAVAGAAVLIVGIVTYQNAQQAIGNTVSKLLTGTSEQENRAIIEMVAGGAGAVIGLVLLIRGRRG